MFRQTIMIGCALAVFGCSSVVQPVAQVSLVEAQEEQVIAADDAIQRILNTNDYGSSQVYAGESFVVSPRFFSARGAYCRTMSNSVQSKLFCQSQNGNWFEVPSVMSELNANETSETE
ncbi:hypothetical protein DRW07_02465 [Alteromonas sediminis]|uniref:Uncharacterized protein n=1 Tax=Alteromonas sediminis TaxID=2259342 RepID=A0A3N5Y485_9ALTE|nr:hypothetical protein [Alteromonas sediminis]RPJ68290.1 hypothetical protein DRW07_02465 [Alteromonas sediminis]